MYGPSVAAIETSRRTFRGKTTYPVALGTTKAINEFWVLHYFVSSLNVWTNVPLQCFKLGTWLLLIAECPMLHGVALLPLLSIYWLALVNFGTYVLFLLLAHRRQSTCGASPLAPSVDLVCVTFYGLTHISLPLVILVPLRVLPNYSLGSQSTKDRAYISSTTRRIHCAAGNLVRPWLMLYLVSVPLYCGGE